MDSTAAANEGPGNTDYAGALREWVVEHGASVPALAGGDTAGRFACMTAVARADLTLARLVEGHLDATAILREAGRTPSSSATYAIWASGGPAATTRLGRSDYGLVLSGTKPFCSGADLVDKALVLVDADKVLVEIDMRSARERVRFDRSQWVTSAFAGTHTATVQFNDIAASEVHELAPPEWYFRRPGFWHGALGPAACWAGGALALVDFARENARDDVLANVHIGALLAASWSMTSALAMAAAETDLDPLDQHGTAYVRALATRHVVDRACVEVIDRFGRLFGPRPYAFDAFTVKVLAELPLYTRQCHAERDLEQLGGQGRSWLS